MRCHDDLLLCLLLQRGIRVLNSARRGSVTGTLVGSTGANGILAFPTKSSSASATRASKLDVGPAFLEGVYSLVPSTYGPYWVVAKGEWEAATSEVCLKTSGTILCLLHLAACGSSATGGFLNAAASSC